MTKSERISKPETIIFSKIFLSSAGTSWTCIDFEKEKYLEFSDFRF